MNKDIFNDILICSGGFVLGFYIHRKPQRHFVSEAFCINSWFTCQVGG